MNVAYIEPIFGLSGDMLLSAFLDLGLPLSHLQNELEKVVPSPFTISTEIKVEQGVKATKLSLVIEKTAKLRNFSEIKDILSSSGLSENVIKRSVSAFDRLAQVEAKIHNIDKEFVHFHELGAVDTIIDIVGFFIALDFFSIDNIYVSKIPIGTGFIDTQHGKMPVPAFATLELLKDFPLFGVDIVGENVTPTGAVLLNSIAEFSFFPDMLVDKIGYGCGNFSFGKYRNLLRLTIGKEGSSCLKDQVFIAEFNVDDMSQELLGNFMQKIFESGAYDCFFTPIFAKKNRPATMITVLSSIENREKVCDAIFSETTTIGIRYKIEDRLVLERSEKLVNTSLGTVRVKEIYYKGNYTFKPEFDDIKKIADEKDIPIKKIYSTILNELSAK